MARAAFLVTEIDGDRYASAEAALTTRPPVAEFWRDLVHRVFDRLLLQRELIEIQKVDGVRNMVTAEEVEVALISDLPPRVRFFDNLEFVGHPLEGSHKGKTLEDSKV